jgi:hypothetical protein
MMIVMRRVSTKREKRTRITASLDAGLVRLIDQRCRQERKTRSALVEEMLLEAERLQKREARDREIEEYYRTMTPKERAEEEAWYRWAAKASIAALKADADLAKDEW